MTEIEKCPLCENKKFEKKLICKDHSKSKEDFTIVSCETCGFLLTNPRPSQDSIGEYYKSESYISHTNSSKGWFEWLYQKIRTHTTKQKVRLLKKTIKTGSHLDIGCGTGEFLNACQKAGFKTKGIEPSHTARKQAIENYSLDVSKNIDLSQYKKNEFDSITMWHVLEHIPNLEKTLTQLKRILKPNGRIIIATPNHECWDAKHYKQYWAAWDVPIHFWHFSQKTKTALLKKYNFDLTQKKPMIFDAYYISLLSEEFISGKKNLAKAFLIGLFSNVFGRITKNGHSSIIYIFKPHQKQN